MTLESSPALTVTAPAGGFVGPERRAVLPHTGAGVGAETTCSGGDEAVKALPGAEDAVPVDEVEGAACGPGVAGGREL